MNFINIIIGYCLNNKFISNLFEKNQYKDTNINDNDEEQQNNQQNNTSQNFFIKISMTSINALYSLINYKNTTKQSKMNDVNNKIKNKNGLNQIKKYEHIHHFKYNDYIILCSECNIKIGDDKEIFCLYDNIYCSILCRNRNDLTINNNIIPNGKRKKY